MKRSQHKVLQTTGLFNFCGAPVLRAEHVRKLSMNIVDMSQVFALHVCAGNENNGSSHTSSFKYFRGFEATGHGET